MHRNAIALLLALTAAPTLAADAPPSPAPAPAVTAEGSGGTHVGLGVSLGTGSHLGFSVPIQIGRYFRVEPEIGLLNVAGDVKDPTARDAQAALAGLGLAWTFPAADQVKGYAGARFQVTMVGYSGSGASASGARAAVVAGGEWLPVPRVSLGIEAQVGYTYSTDPSSGLGLVSGSGVDTAGLFIARIYIW